MCVYIILSITHYIYVYVCVYVCVHQKNQNMYDHYKIVASMEQYRCLQASRQLVVPNELQLASCLRPLQVMGTDFSCYLPQSMSAIDCVSPNGLHLRAADTVHVRPQRMQATCKYTQNGRCMCVEHMEWAPFNSIADEPAVLPLCA